LKTLELQRVKQKRLKIHKNKARPPLFTPKKKMRTPKMIRRKFKTPKFLKTTKIPPNFTK